MGKKGKRQYVAPSKEKAYPYPSRYGSHKSMVVDDNKGSSWVVCEDEKGLYVTSRLRLDSGLTDSWRGTSKEWRKNTLDHYFPNGVNRDDNKPEA